ncbi:hypothetical protein CDV31_013011 [Fusarium ambrosium]|uniref:Uncharacterized protein n=1 Tax=Fusarium ambrosium TaxID=131363 RepID=A0A428T638_9HYPO|nr:hypothetical protein CDV31_013011 [Fusarium ambrosium]
MDDIHNTGLYMDGTMAAAQSDYLANLVNDLPLDDIDLDPMPTLNKGIEDESQGVSARAPVQPPPVVSYIQRTPQGASSRVETWSVQSGPGAVTGFGPGGLNFNPIDYGLSFDNSVNPQSLHINPNIQPRPYQPSNIYPDLGLAGRNGPSYTPMNAWFESTNQLGQMQLTPTQVHLSVDDMRNAYHSVPPQPVRGYWKGEDGGYFRTQQPPLTGFPPFLNQSAYQQPTEAGYGKKRKREDSSSDPNGREDEAGPIRWAGGKVQNNRTLKQRGDIACDPSFVYTDPLPPVENWKKRDGGGPHFEYTPLGQWIDHLEFSAAELRHYLENCPRDVNIFVQQPPAQANCRQQECDRRCRYAQCPVDTKIIRPGFLRVVFDEYHNLTSNGLKDPFKVAGCMHLWCFEQCVDPHEFWLKRKLFPDDRSLPKEQKNLMAINRDTDRAIVNKAFLKWMTIQSNLPGIPEIPRDHKDSLTYALVKHHLDNQVTARQTCRDRRNRGRPEEDRNTLDVHMGDLSAYSRKCREIRTRKRACAKRRRTGSPYDKGLTWVTPRDLPHDPELLEQVQEDVFKGSIRSPIQSPIKTPTPVAPNFEQYVPESQEDPNLMHLDGLDSMQLDPSLMQLTQQTGDSIMVLPEESKEPDEYDYMQMMLPGDMNFKGLSPLEQSSTIPQTQPGESSTMPLDSITLGLPSTDQSQPVTYPSPESHSPEVSTGSRKRQASDLEDDEESLFGSSPRRTRSRGSVASKSSSSSSSSERQDQGAPPRRSQRQSPKRSVA